MDPEEVRAVLRGSGADVWTLIEGAIGLAAREHGRELRERRDGIVELLYAAPGLCRKCEAGEDGGGAVGREKGRSEKGSSSPRGKPAVGSSSPPTPQSMGREEPEEEEEEEEEEEGEEEEDGEDQQSKILAIKEFLEDPDQSEDSLANLLQNLADMDITFKALKETDIGRHVNMLRKHPSSEVRRLVKQLVRKWKDLVDKWVKSNSACEAVSPALITDGDSPQQIPKKSGQNGHPVPDFSYSPNPHNGSLAPEIEPKPRAIQRREAPAKHADSTPSSVIPARVVKEQKDNLLDPERLASARRRLHENYQEAQNAKKQRTIQVMDIHEIPKPRNSFIARNNYKGGLRH